MYICPFVVQPCFVARLRSLAQMAPKKRKLADSQLQQLIVWGGCSIEGIRKILAAIRADPELAADQGRRRWDAAACAKYKSCSGSVPVCRDDETMHSLGFAGPHLQVNQVLKACFGFANEYRRALTDARCSAERPWAV